MEPTKQHKLRLRNEINMSSIKIQNIQGGKMPPCFTSFNVLNLLEKKIFQHTVTHN